MKIKDADKIKVGEIVAEVMAKKITLDDAKKEIKRVIPVVHKDFEMAKDGPELEMIVKREMGWK